MTGTIAERALAAAHDYIVYLRDHGDKSEEAGWKAAAGRDSTRKKTETRQPAYKWRRDYGGERDTNGNLLLEELAAWEQEKESAWERAGRLAEGGRLRVPQGRPAPWNDASVRAAFPDMPDADLIAVLIAADGEIDEEAWQVGRYRNIRKVIEEMVDLRLNKILPEKVGELLEPVVEEVKGTKFLEEK